ncbi:MAG TPA: glycosyl transferase family 36 [Anaerolineae bacterium]
MALFENGYGHFSDDGREFIVTRPDTPMPWVNVISNGDYGLVLSQAGGGYSWRAHAGLNRITRWEQDLIRDEWGKYVYVRDAESGNFWSLSRLPAGQGFQDYRVRHGLGYSVLSGEQDGIAGELTCFVPRHDPCELWLVRLANRGSRPRRLQLFTYFEWLLGDAPDWHREFHRLFIETAFTIDRPALLARKRLWQLPGQAGPHWNRDWPYVAFHSVSLPPTGFDADKLAVLGRLGSLAAPAAVCQGRSGNTAGRGADAIGSLQVEIDLPAGGSGEVVFVLGAADSEEQALELSARYRGASAAGQALAEVQRYWTDLTGALVVETPDPALNLLVNAWLPYQAISGRLWGRSAYYQMGGAYGFRDQLQDSLVWLLLGRPEQTLAQIRLHAAHQFRDGTVLHWWHPLAESGLTSHYSDDLLWLPFVTLAYLDETADDACLEEVLPYNDTGEASLREHCLAALQTALARRSERGIPLILEGDWNDGLNATGARGRGESVWLAHFLFFLLRAWAGLPSTAEKTRGQFLAEADAIAAAANRFGWDGAWFWRATTDEGQTLGSAQDREGKIFLNAQTWAVLSGSADEPRQEAVMAAAREQLYTAYGALLLAPPYSEPDPSVGYLTRYAPGTRENGGVYVHASCWAVLAERKLHGAQAAYALWQTFCPPVRGQDAEAYQAEPYVMPGNVDGPLSPRPGKAGWTWYTGSGQWYLRAAVEGVLGIRGGREGLQVERDLPAAWVGYRATRRFRGATYAIDVRRAGPGERPGCRVDGEPWEGAYLPVAAAGSRCDVRVIVA